jgi:succinate dehydrogenase/fumarate reductase-like Fe-S protein
MSEKQEEPKLPAPFFVCHDCNPCSKGCVKQCDLREWIASMTEAMERQP